MHTEDVALFSTPPVNTAEENKVWIEYRPMSQTHGEYSSLDFYIPGNSLQYINLANTELHTIVQIVKEDGSELDLSKNESGLPIDMIHHTMWSSVDVTMNQTLVSTSGTNYMYKAAIETLLGYNGQSKKIQLSAIGYSGDEGYFNTTHPLGDTVTIGGQTRRRFNEGLKERSKWFGNNYEVEFVGPLLADICNQDRVILNGVDIGIKLWPTKNAFRLITSPATIKCKLILKDVYLNVCKVDINPSALIGLESALDLTTAKYPHQKTDIRVFHIPAGQLGETFENIYQGAVPSKLIIGLVSADAYTGNFQKNPLLFGDYNLSSAGFYVDGIATPTRPINLDIPNNKYLDGLLSLYRVTDKLWDNTDIGITRQTYRDGLCLIGFDVDPTASSDFKYVGVTKLGHTRLELKFRRNLSEPIMCIMYATFPGMIEINKARVVEPTATYDVYSKAREQNRRHG